MNSRSEEEKEKIEVNTFNKVAENFYEEAIDHKDVSVSLVCNDVKNDLNNSDKRDVWTNKAEYLLSVVGYVVDLGNCVRFPYVRTKTC
jgi:hypothetical protein